MSELEKKIAEIVENIVEDARNKWSSHQEEHDAIYQYSIELRNLIQK